MKSVEDEGYKYLGILEMDKIMESEMKKLVRIEYLRRVKLVLVKIEIERKIQDPRNEHLGSVTDSLWRRNIRMECK